MDDRHGPASGLGGQLLSILLGLLARLAYDVIKKALEKPEARQQKKD